jgi:hypothetical protein
MFLQASTQSGMFVHALQKIKKLAILCLQRQCTPACTKSALKNLTPGSIPRML